MPNGHAFQDEAPPPHPFGTNRTEPVRCVFAIDPNFERDALGRWEEKADVLVSEGMG
jgi:hypothetical protein